MDRLVDFSSCKRAHVTFGGSDRKFGVIYEGDVYMLKFSDKHAKRTDISTSYVNNVISEYISSHIAASTGLPVHDTVLGIYNDEVVVGCKDFRPNSSVATIEFSEYVRAKYDSDDVKRLIRLDQIYDTIKDPANDISPQLQKESIARYWDTFVVDALVGNFDRHIGNWAYLSFNNELCLAPAYDFGSTLFPQASDAGAIDFMNSDFEMMKRSLVFPSPPLAISKEKVGKVGYYDMMSSNYDNNCTEAVLRMAPNINLEKINSIIDDTPLISDVRKSFYKEIVKIRKEQIIDRSYVRCYFHEYDPDALNRLITGNQFSEKDLAFYMEKRDTAFPQFRENEQKLEFAKSAEYVKAVILDNSMPPINRKQLLEEQTRLMERFGFSSKNVMAQMHSKEERSFSHNDNRER